MENITLTFPKSKLDELKSFYNDFLVENNSQYIEFMAKVNGITITAYNSKKDHIKITFIGKNALNEAKIWDKTAKINEIKQNNENKGEWVCIENQIGSDEVGVGDFLLPMIVVSSFVRKKDIKMLKQYGVTDSKKLSDIQILEIGEALKTKFFTSLLILPNDKYNEMISKGENLNSLKAKMHNRALLNLLKKFPETKHIFVDQFCNENTYYRYLNDKKEMQVRNITFKTKGETYYPSVALSSVLARYSFLLEKQKLDKKYKMNFPFGASKLVDDFAIKFIKKYGLEEFNKICKNNFKNYITASNKITLK